MCKVYTDLGSMGSTERSGKLLQRSASWCLVSWGHWVVWDWACWVMVDASEPLCGQGRPLAPPAAAGRGTTWETGEAQGLGGGPGKGGPAMLACTSARWADSA